MVESATLMTASDASAMQWALQWIGTYLIHSTVLIVGIWLLTTVLTRMSMGTREVLWKAALLGGIATATLQLGVGAQPPWGHLSLPAALDAAPAVEASPDPAAPAVAPQAEAATVERHIVQHRAGDLKITTIREARPSTPAVAPAAPARAIPTASTPSLWPLVVLGLIALGSSFALIRLGVAAIRLRRQLRGRREVVEDPLLETFLSLCDKAGLGPDKKKRRIKLTASPHLRSPVALGRREIVVPERAIDALTPQQQQGMLAHEMAHLVRRDPLWMVVAAVVEAVFFFQPLNHLARRRLQEVAEFQCDDWAAKMTGNGVHLAKALAEVAAWVDRGSSMPPMASAMAHRGSPIVRRISRLLQVKRKFESDSSGRFVLRLGGVLGLLGLVGWLCPGVVRAAALSAATSEASPASSESDRGLAMMQLQDEDGNEVTFREVRGEDGRRRAQVRIDTPDEIVRVEVEEPPEPPPPPLPPEPPGGIHIRIHGGFGGDALGLGMGSGWGVFGIDIEGLDEELEHELEALEQLLEGDDHGWGHDSWHRRSEAHRERALRRAEAHRERALERAERMRERALRQAERAREEAERARERAEQAREDAESERHGATIFSL